MSSVKRDKFYIPIAVILFLNGAISFAYAAIHSGDMTILWSILTVNFIFFTGLTQGGIIFSAMMRIAGPEWGRYYSRLGEMITLSFAPAALILLTLIIYAGGAEHLFYWISPGTTSAGTHGDGALWFNKDLLFWRNFITMGLFYILSYKYFRTPRREDPHSFTLSASLVIFSCILHNTILAWDFGMSIIPHWESTIFPPYFIIGNIFSGTAFLFILSPLFLEKKEEVGRGKKYSIPMGKLLLGYTLLWTYMLWSQYIVIWYGDIPGSTEPLFRQMLGNYRSGFYMMILTGFVIPFIALIQRWVKSSVRALSAAAFSICIGIWINKYLMITPLFSDGSRPVALTWTGLSLIGGGFGVILISLIIFLRLFPHALEDRV